MRYFIYFILLFSSLNAFSSDANPTQKELCGYNGDEEKVIYDYNHHFGKLNDQASTASCYAFAVASLLEEDNYLRYIGTVPNSFFEKNISVIDIQRCDMKAGHGLGYDGNNDYAFFAMECALYSGGACFDTDAIFNTSSQFSLTTQKGRFEEFMKEYDYWVTIKGQILISQKAEYFWNYLPKDEKDHLHGQGYSLEHFIKAFHNAKNRLDFLNLILTTDRCTNSRNDFFNRELFSSNYYKKNYNSKLLYKKEKMDIIKNALAKKRSSIVILYGGSLTHAAVITGMRMKNGICQLYLRSSMEEWGKYFTSTGWYNDWYNADYLLESTLSIKNLREVSPESYEASKKTFLEKDIDAIYKNGNIYNDPSKW